MAAISAGTLLTNVNNTIFGAGGIGVGGDTSLTLVNSGTINANVNTTSGKLVIDLLNPISNAGLMEATNSGGLYLLSATIANTSAGSVVASGGKAEVILNDSTISGGILRTSGASAMILTDNFTSNNAIIGARIAAKSLIEAVSATLTVSGGTMSADAIVEAASNGTVVVSGTLVNSGGTVFASGVGGVVEIVSGAVVNGGISKSAAAPLTSTLAAPPTWSSSPTPAAACLLSKIRRTIRARLPARCPDLAESIMRITRSSSTSSRSPMRLD
jgi:hypothetical protein